ncbi:Arabidopsis Toxicos en Levadura 49, maternal effect embryo arrest 16 [Hibiscus trionum]|uniref:RING-type E3 ubiquitin transferase n=1 Tax=Hibiscus trionum TaxID=183268 RepID=A0A9W7M1B7_HIBTR|nr:Arabidopsis Toxicos en Levadura 49, maternal effect embryo arrest 16 [Hibiscus trionum]
MDWIFHQRKLAQHLPPSEQPSLSYHPRSPPQSLQSDDSSGLNEVSPTVLLIIILLAIVFFVSGLIHLSVRFLLRRPNRESEDSDNATALQGQLQQLFHLHDAGVDQSLIDTLPVFHYKSIIGVNNPFDCAVCLCEFEPHDKLRLLPNCSHAFHMECIDTWLLSHSTCPLCRASLLPDFSPINTSSPAPLVYVLESGIHSSRESVVGRSSSVLRSNSNLGPSGHTESCEILEKDEASQAGMVDSGEKVVPVKLGKLRNVDGVEGCSSRNNKNNVDSRRCFSMGYFEYVMDEKSFLRVPIRTPSRKKTCLPLTPGHRPAMSECDCESIRGFTGFEATTTAATDNSGKAIGKTNKESFSISKIWLRAKQDRQSLGVDPSRRAFSFRCHSLDSQAKTPSFERRTLGWLGGRQNKVVHSSFTPHM